MAKVLTGSIVHIGSPSIARGGTIKIDTLKMERDDGTAVEWSNISMERSVFDLLYPGAHGAFYHTKSGADLYGVRLDGEKGQFHSSFTSPLMLLMAIGLIFGGLATSMFLLPLLVALAGVAALFACIDARRARGMFLRDEFAASQLRA